MAGLEDDDFGAGHGTAAEGTDAALLEGDDAVAGCVDSEVAADEGALTGALVHPDLAYDDHAGFDFLTTVQLDA